MSTAKPKPPVASERIAITIEPAPARWTAPRPADDAESTRFREQLGLPTGRPIVLTGHQAEFWHPGVLAKFF
ncbi:MAG: hypothetical protein VYC34_00885, partial [Planctomycetota bacterium]|nr:hypothetical protein [Planctomycetota bacterium]